MNRIYRMKWRRTGLCRRLSFRLLALGFASVASLAFAKHGPPAPLDPIVYEGVRYVVPNDHGLRAYVEAWDFRTGKKLWTKTLFRDFYVPIPFLGTECMHYEYVTSKALESDRLIFTSERGKRYVLNLRTRAIRRLSTKGR